MLGGGGGGGLVKAAICCVGGKGHPKLPLGLAEADDGACSLSIKGLGGFGFRV